MSEIFAKLETINGLQILAELVESDDGPKVRFRRDDGIICQVTLGPWPDTPEGWDKAEDALAKADMSFFAAKLDNVIADLKSKSV